MPQIELFDIEVSNITPSKGSLVFHRPLKQHCCSETLGLAMRQTSDLLNIIVFKVIFYLMNTLHVWSKHCLSIFVCDGRVI
jgi:hypothetical protein